MPTATNPTIARLAALCDESGLTRRDIAERAGMRPSNLSRLLSGEYSPSVDSIERLLAAIGYKLAFELTED
jgi:transcriptional regulator with XRE-family HTH domain